MKFKQMLFNLAFLIAVSGCTQEVREAPVQFPEDSGISTINCRCQDGPHTFGPNDPATAGESCENPDQACNNLCNARGLGNGSLSYGGTCMRN